LTRIRNQPGIEAAKSRKDCAPAVKIAAFVDGPQIRHWDPTIIPNEDSTLTLI
jgi:hypothetical protein